MNIEIIEKAFNQHVNFYRPGKAFKQHVNFCRPGLNTLLFCGNNNWRYTRWQIFILKKI